MLRRRKQHQDNWQEIMLKGGSVEQAKSISDKHLRRRLLTMTAVMLVLFGVLGLRLFNVQIASGADLKELANGNRIREEITYAPRGRIFDRNGVLLADNRLVFQLSAIPYLLDDEVELKADVNHLADIMTLDPVELEQVILRSGRDYVRPVVAVEQISHQQALLIESALPQLPGFSLDEVPIRTYNSGAGVAHIVGYSGRVSESDLAVDQTGTLLPTDFIGKAGVEKSFDERLRGQNGWVRYEVDALGRPVRTIASQAPRTGEDIYLSIDFEVQKAMHNAISQQMVRAKTSKASGVAVDPVSGELLAMVSMPAYDNNLFAGGISEADFNSLNNNPDQPLFNKALTGGFTTGSIIKPLVASAGLQEGVVNEQTIIVDGGAISLPGGFVFRGWRPGGLGAMNVRSAIAWSSNIYFYTVGGGYGSIGGLGGERLSSYYRQFGLGERSGIALPNEAYGRVPDEAWKQANKGEDWYIGDSYNISIGQGDLLVSPLQITMAEAAIANNGYVVKPQLERNAPQEVRRELTVDKYFLQVVREGMRQVLTNGTTCDCTFKNVPVTVAGKSGTAETNTPGGRPPHAWYTAFAPYDQSYQQAPEILATVLIEEGAGGSTYAAPAIADTFAAFYSSRAQNQ